MSRIEREQKPTSDFWDGIALVCLAVVTVAMTPLMWLVDKGGDAVVKISDNVLNKLLIPIFGGSRGNRRGKKK